MPPPAFSDWPASYSPFSISNAATVRAQIGWPCRHKASANRRVLLQPTQWRLRVTALLDQSRCRVPAITPDRCLRGICAHRQSIASMRLHKRPEVDSALPEFQPQWYYAPNQWLPPPWLHRRANSKASTPAHCRRERSSNRGAKVFRNLCRIRSIMTASCTAVIA